LTFTSTLAGKITNVPVLRKRKRLQTLNLELDKIKSWKCSLSQQLTDPHRSRSKTDRIEKKDNQSFSLTSSSWKLAKSRANVGAASREIGNRNRQQTLATDERLG